MLDLKSRAKQLKQDVPTLFFCLKDPKTPAAAKLMAGLTVGYALSPLDLIPDFIPVLGYLDDVILLPAMIALTIRLIPKEIWEKNGLLSAGMWADGKPKKWYDSIPVVLIWGLLLWIV